MADHRLDLAEALLAKARSTSFDGERASFVAGAYGQLGAFLGEDAGHGSRSRPSRPQAPGLGSRPAAALPSPIRVEEPANDHESDAVMVVDLAAAERAYRGQSAWRGPSGVLVDLTI